MLLSFTVTLKFLTCIGNPCFGRFFSINGCENHCGLKEQGKGICSIFPRHQGTEIEGEKGGDGVHQELPYR